MQCPDHHRPCPGPFQQAVYLELFWRALDGHSQLSTRKNAILKLLLKSQASPFYHRLMPWHPKVSPHLHQDSQLTHHHITKTTTIIHLLLSSPYLGRRNFCPSAWGSPFLSIYFYNRYHNIHSHPLSCTVSVLSYGKYQWLLDAPMH